LSCQVYQSMLHSILHTLSFVGRMSSQMPLSTSELQRNKLASGPTEILSS
jgi:hypothetical protein